MNIVIKEEFKNDYITREAGEKLRKVIINYIRKEEHLIIDFKKCTIASTSFFDEGFAKLSNEKITNEQIEKYIKIVNLHPRDKELLTTLCKKRNILIK